MDMMGNVIFKNNYNELTNFGEEEQALAQRISNKEWIYVDINGAEKESCSNEERLENWGKYKWQLATVNEMLADGVKAVHHDDAEDKNVIVNRQGQTVAILPEEITHIRIATKGVVIAGVEDEYEQVYDTNGQLLNKARFGKVGEFYNGLAPFIQDGKLGILSDAGQIVIPATYAVGNGFLDNLSLSEDHILFDTSGRIGIIEIVRT